MRIVQGVILVLIGALGAMFYVKIKGGPATPPVQMAALQPPPAQQPEALPAPEPAQPTVEEPAPVPAPQPSPVRPARKHPARTVASPPPPVPEPISNPPAANPADVQPAQEPQPAAIQADPAPPPAAVEPEPVAPTPAPIPAPRQATLTAGTLVSVRLQDAISSDRYHAGDLFTAALDQPLVVDGIVIAEKGARAEGKIVESQQAGRVKGLASIAIELTSIKLSDGQHVEISTDSFTKRAPESHGSDAEKIGGGAALGAIIGAIAGGGKGAAIGAGVGGAAGTGAVVGTRGKPAVLPSETRISFRINNTVTITERRGRS